MTEEDARRIAAEHAALLHDAMALVQEHYKAIAIGNYSSFLPDDPNAASVVISGDIATIHYIDGGYGDAFPAEFNFDARALWNPAAIKEGYDRVEREAVSAKELAERSRLERERAEFERLRRKFEPNADLRADIRTAIEIETRIAAEGAERMTWEEAGELVERDIRAALRVAFSDAPKPKPGNVKIIDGRKLQFMKMDALGEVWSFIDNDDGGPSE